MALPLSQVVVEVTNRAAVALCEEIIPVASPSEPKLELGVVEEASYVGGLAEEILHLDALDLEVLGLFADDGLAVRLGILEG